MTEITKDTTQKLREGETVELGPPPEKVRKYHTGKRSRAYQVRENLRIGLADQGKTTEDADARRLDEIIAEFESEPSR